MRSKALMVALLASLLAGCTGSTPPSKDDPGEVGVVTDPRDLTNRTGEHVHDYWGGKGVLDLVDATQTSTWNTIGAANWRRTFYPADEVVVPQGTASINVTVEWQDGSPADNYDAVSLWVKSANTVEPRFVREIASGDTVEIPLAYEEADLPHQLLSAWEFIVQYNNSGDAYSAFFQGTTHVLATAHRGLELQPFPAHPDLWLGRSEFTLADDTRAMSNIRYIGSGSLPAIIRAVDGELVPADAARVTVDVTLQQAPPSPMVGVVEVWYHPANVRDWVSLGVVNSVDGSATWEIAIEPGMGDGPYNNASLWQFLVYTSDDTTQPGVNQGNVHLVATVHRD